MQSVHYACDRCERQIGDKPHFSFSFNHFSGIAVPPTKSQPKWQVVEGLTNRFIHLCSLSCLNTFFGEMMKRATSKKVKK